MLLLREANEQESLEFSWGYKTGKGSKGSQFYKSFTYDGVEYSLYDCVYVWRDNVPEPDIGKLVKIWESAAHTKLVRIMWFFRPIEIKNLLGDVKPLQNEIFLASGIGTGLSNVNPLETVCGKCKIVCTSKDRRNPEASEEELEMADYIFSRTFDVGNCQILDQFTDLIGPHEVEHFFNKRKDQKLQRSSLKANLKQEAGKVEIPARTVKDTNHSDRTARPVVEKLASVAKACLTDENTKLKAKASDNNDETGAVKTYLDQPVARAKLIYLKDPPSINGSDVRPFKKRLLQKTSVDSKEDSGKCANCLPPLPEHVTNLLNSKHSASYDKRVGLSNRVNIADKASTSFVDRADRSEQDKGLRNDSKIVHVTRRPDVDSHKWFKEQSWEDRSQRAHETGCLVLLENLDPSYTSSEVEDIIWYAFQKMVKARMIQRSTFCSPHNGQALVIFNSKDVAESAISELNNRFLLLNDQRPVFARRAALREPGNPSKFVGHLVIERLRSQKQEYMKNAVSTSHCSQQNTIEYDMAVKWWALQKKSDLWWDALNKKQAKAIESLVGQLKTHSKK